MSELDRENAKPSWAPRVRMEKLRRLYREESRGMLDADLLEDVGTTLYCRCESILIASDAAAGRVHCPRCATVIARSGDDKDQLIVCAKCGWRIRWGEYQKSYQHRDLWGGGFADAMREFMRGWERAGSPRERMLLVDRLIHLWHWQMSREHEATRPAAPSFIEGSRAQVKEFLEELTVSSP